MLRRADPRQHEQFGRRVGAGAQHNIVVGICSLDRPALAFSQFNADRSAAVEQQPRSERGALECEPPISANGADKCARCTAPLALICSRLHQRNAVLNAAINVRHVSDPESLKRVQKGMRRVADWVMGIGDLERTVDAVGRSVQPLIAFLFPKIEQKDPNPTRRRRLLPPTARSRPAHRGCKSSHSRNCRRRARVLEASKYGGRRVKPAAQTHIPSQTD